MDLLRLASCYRLIAEGGVRDVRRRYPGRQKEIDYLVRMDPSGRNKYLPWAIQQVVEGGNRPEAVAETVARFHEAVPVLPKEERDIFSYKYLTQARRAAERARGALAVSEMRRGETGGSRYLGTAAGSEVYEIADPLASACIGRDTKWCLSAKEANAFSSYFPRYRIFFALSPEHKWAILIPRRGNRARELWDKFDQQLSFGTIPRDVLRLVYSVPEMGAQPLPHFAREWKEPVEKQSPLAGDAAAVQRMRDILKKDPGARAEEWARFVGEPGYKNHWDLQALLETWEEGRDPDLTTLPASALREIVASPAFPRLPAPVQEEVGRKALTEVPADNLHHAIENLAALPIRLDEEQANTLTRAVGSYWNSTPEGVAALEANQLEVVDRVLAAVGEMQSAEAWPTGERWLRHQKLRNRWARSHPVHAAVRDPVLAASVRPPYGLSDGVEEEMLRGDRVRLSNLFQAISGWADRKAFTDGDARALLALSIPDRLADEIVRSQQPSPTDLDMGMRRPVDPAEVTDAVEETKPWLRLRPERDQAPPEQTPLLPYEDRKRTAPFREIMWDRADKPGPRGWQANPQLDMFD